jgi:hypothetical protein
MAFEGSSIERSAMMKGEMKLRFPVDLVVRRRETVEQYLKLGDPFMTEIAQHGQVLYERAVV